MRKLAIIPAYNEETNIASVIKNIKKTDPELEIVVINDCSCDKTVICAKEAGVIVLNHPFQMGYGIAIQTGYKYALENKYDIIVQLDGDGQHDPKYIPEMIRILNGKATDVVIGSRFKKKTQYKTPIARRIGIIFFGFIASMITHKEITDPTSGYQVIDKKVLPFLVSEYFPCDFPDADFLIMLHYASFKIQEIPMEMYPSRSHKSMHRGIIKNLYYIFKMCLSITLTVVRGKVEIERRAGCL